MEQNHYYNKQFKGLTKALRNDSTKAEVRLWCELLSKNKMGYFFLRQRSIGNYIADFMCKDLKLIVEVDGYSHQFKAEEDRVKDEKLSELGYTVLRFSDIEVMQDLLNVQRTLESRPSQSSPYPLPRGIFSNFIKH